MPLEQRDLDAIERVIYKSSDDLAVSIARSFERLEERIDAAESRIYGRLSELENKIETSRQDLSDEFSSVRAGEAPPVRGFFRACPRHGEGRPPRPPYPLPEHLPQGAHC